MRKQILLLLVMAALLSGIEPLVETGYAAAPAAPTKKSSVVRKASTTSTAKKKKSRITRMKHRSKSKRHAKRVSARKRQMKERSLSVLREYLPEYADLHEAKASPSWNPFVRVPVGFDTRSPFTDASLRYDLVRNIDRWLGTRYRFGGSSHRGVDCSGFTSAVVSATLRSAFTGSSRVQAQRFTPIFDTDSLQFGDMVFFTGRSKRANRIGHVGIFLGNGVFAHSSTGRGVIYTHISEGYYRERFRWGGRFTDTRLAASHSDRAYLSP